MTLINKINKALHKPSLIIDFMLGTYRTKIYYSRFKEQLLRLHIIEQFEYRMNSIPKKCYNNGQCKECGCSVPDLQMANKSCDDMCYPRFVNKKLWNSVMAASNNAPYGCYGLKDNDEDEFMFLIDPHNKKFIKTYYSPNTNEHV